MEPEVFRTSPPLPLSRTPPLSPIIAPQHPPVPRFPTTPHLATTSLLKPCAVTDPQTPSPVRSWHLCPHSHVEAATFWPSSTCTTQHGAASRRQDEHEGKSENRTKRLRPSPSSPRARTAVSSPIWYFLHRLNFLSTMGDQAACMSPSSHILSSLDMKYPPGCISKRVAKVQQCVEARGPSVASMDHGPSWDEKAWVPRGTGSHGPENPQRPLRPQ